jgi:hypothetical protein
MIWSPCLTPRNIFFQFQTRPFDASYYSVQPLFEGNHFFVAAHAQFEILRGSSANTTFRPTPPITMLRDHYIRELTCIKKKTHPEHPYFQYWCSTHTSIHMCSERRETTVTTYMQY